MEGSMSALAWIDMPVWFMWSGMMIAWGVTHAREQRTWPRSVLTLIPYIIGSLLLNMIGRYVMATQ